MASSSLVAYQKYDTDCFNVITRIFFIFYYRHQKKKKRWKGRCYAGNLHCGFS